MDYAKKVTLHEWPASQNCMDCEHGEPVQFINENDLVATCLCMQACDENDGGGCTKRMSVANKDPLANNPNAPPFPV